ncbi:UNVERIFIED_CONTAM: hypothetical protein Scaly_0100800 [Sesamum calycinum]|uniref:Uncharacterized protein n=1 Tax=Sesamum calycinum TaxID=2727403 RepID=A0AAW2SW84_9LAMI
MYIQGMHWGLQYSFSRIQPRTFEELATRAHDMKLSMTAIGVEGPPIQEPHKLKKKQEAKRGGKSLSKPSVKETMTINMISFKLRGKSNDMSGEKKDVPQERWPRKLTLKEMQTKQHPFLDSDVSGIFDDLLNANLIELPEMKRPKEAGKTDDPKYCKGWQNDSKEKSSLTGFDSLKELVFPLTKIDARKPQRLKGFMRPTQGPEKEHEESSKLQTAKGFDPKAYKLLVKARYNPQERDALGKLSPETEGGQTHGLNAA